MLKPLPLGRNEDGIYAFTRLPLAYMAAFTFFGHDFTVYSPVEYCECLYAWKDEGAKGGIDRIKYNMDDEEEQNRKMFQSLSLDSPPPPPLP